MEYELLNFYKYVGLAEPRNFADKYKEFMNSHAMKGSIIFSVEGINGSVSAAPEIIKEFEKFTRSDPEFSDIILKKEPVLGHPFNKVRVRVRKEICKFTHKVDLKNAGNHLTPKELHEWYEKKKDFVIVDARNNYEYEIGRFRGAINSNLEAFSEFPKVAKLLEGKENKPIVLYCTGGVRCEKASAYLKENGFNDVHQLWGGIITYLKEYQNADWEGRCFVFDKRLAQTLPNKGEPISKCVKCGKKCDTYMNCEKAVCNNFFVMCEKCKHSLNGYCSNECKNSDEKITIKAIVPVKKKKWITKTRHSSNNAHLDTGANVEGLISDFFTNLASE